MPKVIVGVDPGRTTGLCAYRDNGEFLSGKEAKSSAEVEEYLKVWMPDVVILEDFRIGGAKVDYRDPLTMIGAVEHLSQSLGAELVLQQPRQQAKDLSGVPHPSAHVRSASAHVLTYLGRQRRKSAG
jgi:hypothetical protein